MKLKQVEQMMLKIDDIKKEKIGGEIGEEDEKEREEEMKK